MNHLIFLFNLATLACGIVLAAVLWTRMPRPRQPRDVWTLVLFLAMTWTMTVAAIDAYVTVNIGMDSSGMRLFTFLVLLGLSALHWIFPHHGTVMSGKVPSPGFSLLWLPGSIFIVIVAFLMLLAEDLESIMPWFLLSFVPFAVAVVHGLVRQRGMATGMPPWLPWAGFLVLGTTAVVEVWWALGHQLEEPYYFITLPLSYLYSCWTTWKVSGHGNRSPGAALTAEGNQAPGLPAAEGGPVLGLPPALAADLGLTAREIQIAEGILRGMSNKELAAELRIAENTARNHIYNLYRKLEIQKRLDLVLLVQKYQAQKPLSGTKVP